MTTQTLFLIQSDYAHTDQVLDQLEQIHSINDHIVLTGDAVLFAHDIRLQSKQNLYVLENDAEILSESLPSQIKLISYDQFADLVLDFTRCMSLK
ncbi:hypothetical protein EXE10_14840 [Acinetobacter sp. WCHAc060033]|uniref:DsrH/TusB family sulfur metabolism protein n=1 Tax=Acinetobacter sp. WCHAc060033 TaxID=2518624 RepID=UPI0010231697|nr:DsrH/TusB family sulfur metabolism protein [Acinetobacter sp. WCHAc060033]RZG79933.1 hypothetical protein EXE10_14840 [Acinetobacter sp. WCHAc060033]